jgi:hypothetical protein
MLSGKDFRRIALGMKGAIEGAHMGHPDFRVNNRIFATLRHRDTLGMVVLAPDEQQRFIQDYPDAFEPERGAWGRSGCTRVQLSGVDEDALGEAMTLAWRTAASRPPARPRKAVRPANGARRPARRPGRTGKPD